MRCNIKETNRTSGNVRIVVKDNSKTRDVITKHNQGTIELCKFLRDALLGQASIDKLPDKIAPFNLIDKNGAKINSNINEQGFYKYSNKLANNDASATFKFLIPSSYLTKGSVVDGFNLYAGKTHYATVFLNESVEILANTSLLVDWTILISASGGE